MDTPEAVNDWLYWAQRLDTGSLYHRADFEDKASSMPESLIDELGTLYSRAVAESHLAVINDWLTARAGHTPMNPTERQVRNLAILFGHLGSRGWPPFSSQQINGGKLTPATPDWTKLPEELRFVGPYAERTKNTSTYSPSNSGNRPLTL